MIKSQICQFYKNQKVLITGGTGFMGKILIEKLLRSTQVSKIYVLIRQKKNKDPRIRLREVLNDVLFEKLSQKEPNFQKRLVAITGNCSFPDLGLSPEDYQTLINNVNVVFHVAACVRFDENIKSAFDINVKGTVNLLEFCEKITLLKSIVHVSTAYSNCILDTVDEIFYDPPVDYTQLEAKLERLSLQEAHNLTSSLLKEWPNTYTFTKCLAEEVVKKKARKLPIAVFRPSIVSSTYNEPLAGWTNNYGGTAGIIINVALGFLRVFICDPDAFADLVPADKAIAALIATAWDIHGSVNTKIPIYNFVSCGNNPLTWHEVTSLCFNQLQHYPLSKAIWWPRVQILKISFRYQFLKFFYDYIPSLVVDLLTFGRFRMLSTYYKVAHLSLLLGFFTQKSWEFKNENVKMLWDKMNEEDRQVFPFDMASVQWLQFFRDYYKGLRFYLLKDPPETIPKAKKRARRLKIAHYLLIFFLYFVGMSLLMIVLLFALTFSFSE